MAQDSSVKEEFRQLQTALNDMKDEQHKNNVKIIEDIAEIRSQQREQRVKLDSIECEVKQLSFYSRDNVSNSQCNDRRDQILSRTESVQREVTDHKHDHSDAKVARVRGLVFPALIVVLSITLSALITRFCTPQQNMRVRSDKQVESKKGE